MDRSELTELLFRAADDELDPELATMVRQRIESCQDTAREALYVQNFLRVVRMRCARRTAPMRLRLRILTRFDHRRTH